MTRAQKKAETEEMARVGDLDIARDITLELFPALNSEMIAETAIEVYDLMFEGDDSGADLKEGLRKAFMVVQEVLKTEPTPSLVLAVYQNVIDPDDEDEDEFEDDDE